MRKILLSVFIFAFLLSPVQLFAQEEGEVKAAVSVAAIVPTKICTQYSSVVSNVTELLADNSQKSTITVHLRDCLQNSLPGLNVSLASNRGAIDKIDAVDENGEIIASGDGTGINGLTDLNGFAFFRLYSKVPGETTIIAKADSGLVELGSIKVKFLSLPFPTNIVIIAEVPDFIASSGQITIFKPKDLDINKENLVNLTMELRIPRAVFYFVIILIILNLSLFLIILYQTLRIRQLQKVEIAELKEEKELIIKEEAEIATIAKKK